LSKNLKDEIFGDSEDSVVKAWVKNIMDSVKEAFGIGSGKSIMRNEVGKVLSCELGDGLEENMKDVVKAFKSAKSELDYQRDLDLIDEAAYYDNLEILRDRYFAQGSDNWVKYTAEIYKYQKKLLDEETKNLTQIYDVVADYAESKFNEIGKKQDRFASKLVDYGGIYKKNTVYMNGSTDVYYSTRDLRADIDEVKSYVTKLMNLKKLLGSNGLATSDINSFIDEIDSMGVSQGLSYMNYLLAGGTDNAISYAKLWAEKNAVSQSLAGSMYKDEFEVAAEDVAVTLKTALENAGYTIPEGFFESGKLSAENFGKAFLSEIELQFEEIRSKIQQFTSTLSAENSTGNTYNSTTNQYNISSSNGEDTIEVIKRHETVKRLSGV